MRSTRRPLAALALLALIALLVAGDAGYSNAAARTGRGGANSAAIHEQGVKYAQCMRDNGVKDFPDPAASGEFTIDGVVNGSSLDPNSASWKKAIGACKDLGPPGFMGSKRSAQQQQIALKFAQCVRGNGVTDFPDPAPDGPLVDTNRIPSAATKDGMSRLNAAMRTCGAEWGDRLGLAA